MAAKVRSVSFMSCRLAPSTLRPMGSPCPSVNNERLVPCLPRSVGFRPVLSPPQRGLRHRSVQRLPLPVDPDSGVELQQAHPPELLKDARLAPLHEAVVDGTRGAKAAGQRFPLTARPQQEEDPVHGLASRRP